MARARLEQTTGPPPVVIPPSLDTPELVADRRQAEVELKRQAWGRTVPRRFITAKLDDLDPGVAGEVAAWLAEGEFGSNLVAFGPVGTGKTHLAIAAARDFFDRGFSVRFLPVVELLDFLRPGGPDDALYALADIDVLVVDDLGSERATEWTAERLFALFNRRWLEGHRTIATTNLSPEVLESDEGVGPRTFSRLVGSGALVLKLTGKDRRRC